MPVYTYATIYDRKTGGVIEGGKYLADGLPLIAVELACEMEHDLIVEEDLNEKCWRVRGDGKIMRMPNDWIPIWKIPGRG